MYGPPVRNTVVPVFYIFSLTEDARSLQVPDAGTCTGLLQSLGKQRHYTTV